MHSSRFCAMNVLNCGRRQKKSLAPYFTVPDGKSITMYNDCNGIDWKRYQLVDILLPALLAMDTFTSESSSVEVKWLRRDTAHGT